MNINATLFVQMVVFFIGCWITMKYIWPPLIKAIEERQQKIADGLAAADKSNIALAEAQAKGKEIEAEARARATTIVSDGEKRGAKIVEAAKEQARTEADAIISAAKAEAQQKFSVRGKNFAARWQRLLLPVLRRFCSVKLMRLLTRKCLINLRRSFNHGRTFNDCAPVCRRSLAGFDRA